MFEKDLIGSAPLVNSGGILESFASLIALSISDRTARQQGKDYKQHCLDSNGLHLFHCHFGDLRTALMTGRWYHGHVNLNAPIIKRASSQVPQPHRVLFSLHACAKSLSPGSSVNNPQSVWHQNCVSSPRSQLTGIFPASASRTFASAFSLAASLSWDSRIVLFCFTATSTRSLFAQANVRQKPRCNEVQAELE